MLDYLGSWNSNNAGTAAAGPDKPDNTINDDRSRTSIKYGSGSMYALGSNINVENMN